VKPNAPRAGAEATEGKKTGKERKKDGS